MNASHSHIVAIRRLGVIEGHQLRFDGGGPGQSKFFSAGKYGSPEKARRAAERTAKAMGLPQARARGGSVTGRVPKKSLTGEAGIRFAWVELTSGPALRVVASWRDRSGRARQTSYSCDYNGLDGALDLAIARRTSCGAPQPDRAALLKRLRKELRTH